IPATACQTLARTATFCHMESEIREPSTVTQIDPVRLLGNARPGTATRLGRISGPNVHLLPSQIARLTA
ncbi:MAG TPA: hypothetical protein VFD32_21510, partial [Dehalococcoidia bacterium]|nr:hypothetical protein [Dehalococcoidia bacterium]